MCNSLHVNSLHLQTPANQDLFVISRGYDCIEIFLAAVFGAVCSNKHPWLHGKKNTFCCRRLNS